MADLPHYSKEAFDAELFGILEAFRIAVKEEKKNSYTSLTIFSDSQAAFLRLQDDKIGPEQTLAAETIRIAEKLTDKGIQIFIRWVPSHINVEGNKKADFLAKKAANQPKKPSN